MSGVFRTGGGRSQVGRHSGAVAGGVAPPAVVISEGASVRRANTLTILTLMFACGGLLIGALAVMRGDEVASGRLWSAGKLLLMLAATGGWLGLIGLRRDCRKLTEY